MRETLIGKRIQKEYSKTVGVKLKESDIAALNQRFRIDGFETLGDLVRSYLDGRLSASGKTDQIERLLLRLKERNITDPLTGEISATFYRNIDIQDFKQYLRGKYKYRKYADDLTRYFERFAELFFTKPEIVRAETGRNRSWICDAMRRFAEYYDYRFQNPELKLLVREIIERYEINRHMRMHDKVWITDQNYLDNTICKILNAFTRGELAILIRFALFSGLRGEEIAYVHDKPICNRLASCDCDNLHVANKENGMSVIVVNRIMGQKHCYFTIVPTRVWLDFRSLPKTDYEFRKFAHLRLKEVTNGEVALMDLRKFNYNVNTRSEMKEMGAEVLAGRAKTVSARHYLLNELDVLAVQYGNAWRKYVVSA